MRGQKWRTGCEGRISVDRRPRPDCSRLCRAGLPLGRGIRDRGNLINIGAVPAGRRSGAISRPGRNRVRPAKAFLFGLASRRSRFARNS